MIQEYEYKAVEIPMNNEQQITNALNEAAQDGWRYVNMEAKGNKIYAIYQKLKQIVR